MFLAIRDIRFAKGRFALMGSVVALITLLIVLLSGLTAGLAHGSTAVIKSLPTSHIVFGGTPSGQPSFTDSTITADQVQQWSGAEGVSGAAALGISRSRLGVGTDTASVVIVGTPPSSQVAPPRLSEGSAVVSAQLADEQSLHPGDTVVLGGAKLTVSGVVSDAMFNHSPVAWVPLSTWQDLGHTSAGSGQAAVATVLAVQLTDAADVSAIDEAAGTTTRTTSESLSAIGSFSSENMSLTMMQVLLYAISALVIGAFLTVWTVQRSGDIAILKALGGSTRYLLRDALAQALVVLLLGAGVGGLIGVGLGALAAGVVPFTLTVSTTLLPAAILIALGMLGAALAVRRITTVDPLTALGSVR